MDILRFKGYEGSAELDMSTMACRGKLLFIDDLVTYEADTPAQLKHEFELAVEDYLQTCAEIGKEPQRPFKGLFNVRVSPDLHRSAALRATKDGISLNEVVVAALKIYLSTQPKVEPAENVVVLNVGHQIKATAMPTASMKWRELKGVARDS